MKSFGSPVLTCLLCCGSFKKQGAKYSLPRRQSMTQAFGCWCLQYSGRKYPNKVQQEGQTSTFWIHEKLRLNRESVILFSSPSWIIISRPLFTEQVATRRLTADGDKGSHVGYQLRSAAPLILPYQRLFLGYARLPVSFRLKKEYDDSFCMRCTTKTVYKMSKKYESANVSEVEDHISLKYEIKRRLGKGVSV